MGQFSNGINGNTMVNNGNVVVKNWEYGVFHKGTPIALARWMIFVRENHLKWMMDLGVPICDSGNPPLMGMFACFCCEHASWEDD